MKSQLFKKLAEQIYTDYADVRKLPGERRLGERYVASRATIRAALQELQNGGRLVSDPRRGHTLIPAAPSREERTGNVVPPPERRAWNVVLFCSRRLVEDQAFLDFLGGAIHSAGMNGVNLLIRELDERHFVAGAESPEQLYSGVEADGYILTFLSEGLRQFLERQLKPCVALGMPYRVGELEKRRFLRVFLPQREKLTMLFSRLAELGHRRILVPCGSEELGGYVRELIPDGVKADFVKLTLNSDSSVPRPEAGDRVMAALGDHTALLVPFGGATALEIYRRLLLAGIEIPKRLSVVIDSGRFDYFVKVFRIASTYSSSREEGMMCMEALVGQLRNGFLEFGNRFTRYSYMEGETLGPAMTPVEQRQYDRRHRNMQ